MKRIPRKAKKWAKRAGPTVKLISVSGKRMWYSQTIARINLDKGTVEYI